MENQVTVIEALEDREGQDLVHVKEDDGKHVAEIHHEDGLWMSMNQFAA